MRLVLSLIAAVLLLRAADAAVDITACGQSVPDFDTGTLQADLDCVAPGWCLGSPSTPCQTVSDCGLAPCVVGAVRLGRQATLQMNGYSITSSDLTMIGVFCVSEGPQKTCTVAGPGSITHVPVAVYSVRDATVTGVQLSDVELGPGYNNMVPNAIGLSARRLSVTNTTVTGGGRAALSAVRVNATNVVIQNGGRGIEGRTAVGTNLMVVDNAGAGIATTGRITLVDSRATGNGSGTCPDLVSEKRPVLINSTCDHSGHIKPHEYDCGFESFGVCTND